MSLLSAALLAAMVHLAERRGADPVDLGSVPASTLIAPPPAWQRLPTPPLYGLAGPSSPNLEARRHADGGREDVLTVGHFGEPGHAQLRIRRGIAGPWPPSFYVDLVRQAAQAGLAVVRSGQASVMTTKFGPAETATLTLAGAGRQTCQGVRLLREEVAFSLHGWLCGVAPSAADLACLIDRMTLLASEDPALKALFAQSEGRRACGPAPQVAEVRRPSSSETREADVAKRNYSDGPGLTLRSSSPGS
jgi:hypothetical protein